jgi:hypothetical protein
MTIMSTIFLVVAGYNDRQVAPAMSLLGTVVGYVLGAARNPTAPVARGEPKPAS